MIGSVQLHLDDASADTPDQLAEDQEWPETTERGQALQKSARHDQEDCCHENAPLNKLSFRHFIKC